MKYTKKFYYLGMIVAFDRIEFDSGKIHFWRKVENENIIAASIKSDKGIKITYVIDVSEEYKIVSFEFR
ncbi:hypothetical protein [Clostridium sp.]|uniref:hypothetical protein n=1 Tax=Clostridium sp. TaxID=1506 RepID=UPI00283E3ABE|nr:hypothetical protein [Clostridium sp.]MDR3595073.1 hypothetical protein [Clostridium sp.]